MRVDVIAQKDNYYLQNTNKSYFKEKNKTFICNTFHK